MSGKTNEKSIVNVHEAKTHLSRLLERAHNGEEIILAKSGEPYARLVPLERPSGERTPGQLRGMAMTDEFFDDLPDDELDAWEGS